MWRFDVFGTLKQYSTPRSFTCSFRHRSCSGYLRKFVQSNYLFFEKISLESYIHQLPHFLLVSTHPSSERLFRPPKQQMYSAVRLRVGALAVKSAYFLLNSITCVLVNGAICGPEPNTIHTGVAPSQMIHIMVENNPYRGRKKK